MTVTWLTIETIYHFLRNESEVFSCVMDMRKAFDMVQQRLLLRKLLSFLKQLISCIFTMVNGVKQGAVLSALLYCIYVNGLFEKLRFKRAGCWMGSTYLGILGYADDNLLLAPSRQALQEMLLTCELYAKEHNLQFSTNENPTKSKTKCLAFLKKQRIIPEMRLNGRNLPWVKSGIHLGNTVENDINGMKQDTRVKRAGYIQKNNELNQEFRFAHPRTKFHLNAVYNSHFSGSSLWNLFGKEVKMMETSWNLSFKIKYDLPLLTHRYFVEPITGKNHAKTLMIKNFLKFCELIVSSKKEALKNVFLQIRRNVLTFTGSNLRKISSLMNKSDITELKSSLVKQNLVYEPIPEGEKWRISILEEIIDFHEEKLEIQGFERTELDEILEFICVT